ncbi:MAG TPA: DNA polymerase III subunit alpha [Planctomycetes bacterium]|nr:DNA polymerase III subunit alpha [Planctomycetota bacterium]
MSFVHLSVRSCFSLLEGTTPPEQLCRLALARGHSTFVLADRNGLYGLPVHVLACEHFGIQPAIGSLLDGATNGQPVEALVLPTSRAGYAALCRAITARHAFGPAFDLARHLLAEPSQAELRVVTPHPALLRRLREGLSRRELYVELRRRRDPGLEELARELGLETVATAPVVCGEAADHEAHKVLRAIASKRTLGRLDPGALASSEAWLQPAAAVAAHFWDEVGARALRNSAALAEACRFGGAEWGYGVLTFPRWEGARPAVEELRESTLAGLRRRYGVASGAGLPLRVRQRLERELDLVVRKGFADYFLIVRDLVEGFPRTCGRGSAAASLIAYALSITHVDPVRHDLFFERFLNEGRVHPPDIDVDFPWDERDEVLARVFQRWGPRAAMVANHVCFRPRAALREVARSHGLPDAEISAVTSRLPYFHAGASGRGSVGGTLGSSPLTRGIRLDPPWDRVVALAETITGLPRHLSVHPGGVVITPGPITDHCPTQTAPKGVPILQWEKDGTEEAGLVKIDLLGNRSLAVIRDALAAAREHGHDPPRYEELDVSEDPRCEEMLARGETMGCFYVESPAMRQLQSRSQRGDFEHLVIHSSIIRPAANAFIREYLRRLHGGPWEPLHPRLERILQGTLGLTAYQEDLARLAIELAGFSAHEGDGLRKVLSRKSDLRLADVRARFAAGARERGLSEGLIDSVWSMMESFAGYSFCKSHSASYALVSFKCCYLRDRFPAEFLAGVISNGGGFYSTLGYLGEARRLGLRVLPACVNESGWAWRGEGRALRAGLMQVRGLRKQAAEALVAAREEGGAFLSFDDLVRRVEDLQRDELAQLARAGALEALDESNLARLQWRIALLARRAGAGALFAEVQPHCPAAPAVSDLAPAARLEQELLAYGLPLRAHPLALWEPELGELDVVPAREVERHVGREVRVCGWLVTAKLVRTKSKEAMEFVTLEDRSGLIDVTVFPRVYQRHAQVLHAPRPVVVTGRVEEEFGVVSVVARRIRSWWGACLVPEPSFLDADRSEEDLLEA